jgi:hypothetical protein
VGISIALSVLPIEFYTLPMANILNVLNKSFEKIEFANTRQLVEKEV